MHKYVGAALIVEAETAIVHHLISSIHLPTQQRNTKMPHSKAQSKAHPTIPESAEVFQGAVLFLPNTKFFKELVDWRVVHKNEVRGQNPIQTLSYELDEHGHLPKGGPYSHPIMVLSRAHDDPDHIVFVVVSALRMSYITATTAK